MFDLDRWLDKYIEAVDAAFGARIVFIGLQGSYARGEAHEGSDIVRCFNFKQPYA